jgi:hypothetical protein
MAQDAREGNHVNVLYDVTGQAHNDARVPLAGDLASYAEAAGLAERYSRDAASWRRVTVRNADTGELICAYAGGERETIGTVQAPRR